MAGEIFSWSEKNIPDGDLALEGRETQIHVTIKYGIHTHRWDKVRDLLLRERPFELILGPVSIFHNDEHDVVKLSVTSPDLVRLNKILSDSFEHTDTHPDYIPHLTLAYVQSGFGKRYVGRKDFAGRKVVI